MTNTHFHNRTWLNGLSSIWLQKSTSKRTFLHSWAHRFGLQRFASTIAIRVILSVIAELYLVVVGWMRDEDNDWSRQHYAKYHITELRGLIRSFWLDCVFHLILTTVNMPKKASTDNKKTDKKGKGKAEDDGEEKQLKVHNFLYSLSGS